MRSLILTAVFALWFAGSPTRWNAVDDGPCPRPVYPDQAGPGIDPRTVALLRETDVQKQLGLSDEQKAEVARRLALIPDSDQEDLLRMILGQYHAAQARIRDLEDPEFEDDEEGPRELETLKAMVPGLRARTLAMIDRVLTPVQRAALGPRPSASDPVVLAKDLAALTRRNVEEIATALTSHQRDQLRQLAIRAEGPLAALRPDVAAHLKLSDDQRTRIRAIWAAAQAKLDRLRDPSPISPAYRDEDDLDVWMRPRLATIRQESARILADAAREIGAVLEKNVARMPPCGP